MGADQSQGGCQFQTSRRIQTLSHRGWEQGARDGRVGDGKCLRKKGQKLQIVVCGIISRQNKLLKIIENEDVKADVHWELPQVLQSAKWQVWQASHFDDGDDDDANDSDAFCLANAFFCFESLIRERTKKRLLSPVYPLRPSSTTPSPAELNICYCNPLSAVLQVSLSLSILLPLSTLS